MKTEEYAPISRGNDANKESAMMIRVLYKNQSAGMVKNTELEELMQSGRVAAFFRSGAWVSVEDGPVRGKGDANYGPERRGKAAEMKD